MKRMLAWLLAAALLCMAGLACAEGTGGPYFRQNIHEYGEFPLPDTADFASMKTYQVGDTITVTLSKPVDRLIAQWMGYGEEYEEVKVGADLTAKVSALGHKCQIGATWKAKEVEETVETVLLPFRIKEEGKPERMVTRAEIQEILTQTSAAMEAGLEMEVVYPYWSVDVPAGGEGQWTTLAIYDFDTPEAMMTVPAGASLHEHDGSIRIWKKVTLPLDGSPNEAYAAVQGIWTVIHQRNGQIKYFYATVEGADFFGMGPGLGTVSYAKGGSGWYPEMLTQQFPGASPSAVMALYDEAGTLIHVEVTP